MAAEALVPRAYQEDVTRSALERNVVVRADTGSGKTLIAVLLIRAIAAQPRQIDDHTLIIFLTPTVTLVHQQASVLEAATTLRVKSFVGASGVDVWKTERWREELSTTDIAVLTPQVWLNALSAGYFDLRNVSLMVFDEAHHAQKRHPAAEILRQHYHPLKQRGERVLKILGLTASPIWNVKQPWKAVAELESNLDARILEISSDHRAELEAHTPRAQEQLVTHSPTPPDVAADAGLARLLLYNVPGPPNAEQAGRFEKRLIAAYRLFGTAGARLLLYEATPTTPPACDSPAILSSTSDELSPKVKALVASLEPYSRDPNAHIIVFVEQRHHASVLVELIKRIDSLRGWTRPAALVGHGREGWGRGNGPDLAELGMAIKEQQAIVAAFRAGEYNLVVATRVAEEGLDIQKVNVVVRFDALTTITGYVQSRGRARASDARYIVIAEEGSPEAAKYKEYVAQEAALRDMYERRDELPDDPLEPELDNLPTYSTAKGALLTHQSAIPTLAEFFQLLRYDVWSTVVKPEFALSAAGPPWFATLTVPKTAALDRTVFVSDPMPTKKAAKQRAAFEVCLALHRAGALDDHLLPIREKAGKGSKDADGREVNVEPIPAHLDLELPNNFGNVWNSKQAFVHVVEISLPNIDQPCRLALVSGRVLPAIELLTLFTREGTSFAVKGVATSSHDWPSDDERDERLAQLEAFNRTCTRIVLNRRIEDDVCFFALCAPVDTAGQIDWAALDRAFSSLDIEKVKPGDLVVVPLRRPTARIGRYLDVRTDVDSTSPTHEIEPDSPTSKRKLIARYPDYHVYLKVAYDYHGSKEGIPEPVVRYEPLDVRPHNALVPPEQRFELPPKPYAHNRNFPVSMIQQTTLPLAFFSAFSLVPSLNRSFLETAAAVDTVQRFDLPANPPLTLVQALTAPSCCRGFDYQLLETLGDSALKVATSIHIYLEYPRGDENRLTRLRENSVGNLFLRRRAIDTGFASSIIPYTLRSSTFVPETSDDADVSADGLSIKKRLSRRLLSDVVEAILGAAALVSFDTAMQVGDRLGLCFGGITPWSDRPSGKSVLANLSQAAGPAFRKIEEAFGYRFERGGQLLKQALTHRSFVDQSASFYEREEYLGDSLLDWWTTLRLYLLFPNSTPGKLSYVRSMLVSNGVLALLAVKKLDLHKMILHSSPPLETALREAAEQGKRFEYADVPTGALTWLWDPPKVLGDVLEALLAVVFLDCGMQLEPVLEVLDRLYADIMPHIKESDARDPYSRFLIWKAKRGCTHLSLKVTSLTDTAPTLPKSPYMSARILIQPTYTALVTFHGEIRASQTSSSKAVSRQLAAKAALEVLAGEAGARCDCVKEKAKKPIEEDEGADQDGSDGGASSEQSTNSALVVFDEETKEEEEQTEAAEAQDEAIDLLVRIREY
ncbi:Dicer-like protein 1 [Rhodotorula toruloides]